MSGIDSRMGVQGVLALRAEILERSDAIRRAAGTPAVAPAPASGAGAAPAAGGFGAALETAVRSVNDLQSKSGAMSAAYERGETQDIASVMLARQKSSVAFEATVQVRNRLLSAYRDIMNMPV